MALRVTFNPITRVAQLLDAPIGGLSAINVQRDIYSAGKEDWLATPDLRKLQFPFLTDGGRVVTTGKKNGAYFFIRNDLGWRLRPFAASHELTVDGMLYPFDITIPVITVPTGFTITIFNERSNLAQSIEVEASVPATVIAAAVWSARDFTYLDNTVYDANKLLLSARERVFPTKALADAATPNSVGVEGATEVYSVIAVAGPTLGAPTTYRRTLIS